MGEDIFTRVDESCGVEYAKRPICRELKGKLAGGQA